MYLLGRFEDDYVSSPKHNLGRLCLIFWPLFLRWFSAEVLFLFFARIIQNLNPAIQVELVE